ncbi:MAG: 23S rRNA (adenine(2503)-C(2))-methyltransferase RlmN [Endomicrobium sp.]|jgi:23S rRNA (adenine2503-C2)-methyltransferase|nr:23S rRNA (adenine(2503)-C(2))-methyltransferase RlmN [Endomicrobium sp.]
MKKYILNFTVAQFKATVKNIIKEDYKINQIIEWVYVKKVSSFNEFTNISKDLREELNKRFTLRDLKIVKKERSIVDRTIRYTFQTVDKKYFFAVFLSTNGKNSVCISSQIGCPISCIFCSSGRSKLIRNLTRGEILEQILQIENDIKEKISGVLFMGMGEPTLNLNNTVLVLNSLLSNKEFGIGKRHITLSSVGNVLAIKKLADGNFNVRLALSLHSVDEKQRRKLIPNNFGFHIGDILNAGKYYLKKTKSHLTIEYILIKNINDSAINAHKLVRLLRHYELLNPNVQVNLMPFNLIDGTNLKIPQQKIVQKFKNILKLNGIIVNIRQAKGADIKAACGQLGY